MQLGSSIYALVVKTLWGRRKYTRVAIFEHIFLAIKKKKIRRLWEYKAERKSHTMITRFPNDYLVVVFDSEACAIGFNFAATKGSGNFNGAAGVETILSSFSPLRTFSISSLVKVSYSISAFVRSSNSLRFSVKILVARSRPSSTRRLVSDSTSCLVSEDSLS